VCGAGYALSLGAFLMVAIVVNKEMDSFVPTNTWLIRMPLVATFAAQLAKLRVVVTIIEADERSYFFWLFVALTALQGLLALWAVPFACPMRRYLQLPWGSLNTGYEVRRRPLAHCCHRAAPPLSAVLLRPSSRTSEWQECHRAGSAGPKGRGAVVRRSCPRRTWRCPPRSRAPRAPSTPPTSLHASGSRGSRR
jgi:hypothetical protein